MCLYNKEHLFIMATDRINDIILSFFKGDCTEVEKKELDDWCLASKENLRYFEYLRYTWISTAQLRKEPIFETESALKELQLAISVKVRENNPGKSKLISMGSQFIATFLKYAAIFVLIFLSGGTVSYWLVKNNQTKTNAVCYFEAPIGSKGKAILPDGTQVWLNAGSNISYSTDYNSKDRIVELTGEGYFDVKTNPQKPFIVKAKGLNIKAYGTAFNVRAYAEEKRVITTLVRGKVNIEGIDRENKPFTIQMKPKQSVFYSPKEVIDSSNIEMRTNKSDNIPENQKEMIKPFIDEVKISSVKTELYTSWKDKRWIIENALFKDLVKELERRYDVKFYIQPEELMNYHFTGTIENESIEQVLNILSFTLPIKYDIIKNHIDLRLDQGLKSKYLKAM